MPRTEDSLTAKQAEVTAQQGPAFDPAEMALPEAVVPVPVRDDAPALGRGGCQVLSTANPVAQLLPQDPRRRLALILAVENDVYLTHSLELAQAVAGTTTGRAGFYLPAGTVLAVSNRAAWWAAATTVASSTRVSVMLSLDDG